MQLHIQYLRLLEDSERVREACLQYLQSCLIYFYPDRPDLVKAAELMAIDLGGQLGTVRLPWKYHWIQPLFGCRAAKYVQVSLPTVKWSLKRVVDKALFQIDNSLRYRGRKSIVE